MNLTIPQADLSRELSIIAGCVEKKTTIPILGSIRMVADAEGLTLTATDLTVGATVRVPCTVKAPGAIAIHAKRLQSLASSLSGDIGIKVGENNWASITAGKSRSRIPGQSVESFPDLPSAPAPFMSVDARGFLRQVNTVKAAISTIESRFTLDAALVAFTGGKMLTVATDGHRLHFAQSDAANAPEKRFLMPLVAIAPLAKLIDNSEGGAQLAISEDDNHLFFTVGPRLLLTQKKVGSFPDYTRVLPKDGWIYAPVTTEREALKAALNRVVQFADERSHAIKVTFAGSVLTVAGASVDAGESEETLAYEGDLSVECGFNADYIRDALDAISTERVEVWMKDAKGAAEFRPAGTAAMRLICMPMRI